MSKSQKPSDGAKPAAKASGVSTKLLERLSEDEGIVGGIQDDEAKLLLDALKKELAAATAGKSGADVEAAYSRVVTRGRTLGTIISAWCYDGEPDKAKKLWADGGGKGTLDALPAEDAVGAMKLLLAMEGLGHG